MGAIRGTAVRLMCVVLAVAAAAWLGVGVSHADKVRLDAGPGAETFDLPIHARIHGLDAGERVTVQASSSDATGMMWNSWAQFTAGKSGKLDLATAVPDKGTYQIADAGGLLWSLQPAATDPSALFGLPATGFAVRMRVLVGGDVVAEQTLTRSVPVAARDLTVAQTGFAGSLFLPPNAAAEAPAVVVIGGSEGGVPKPLAAAFQAAGYPALALGYFREPGLPACLCAVPLEYFAHAVAWLRAQPGFATRPLVLWGGSRGGEGALALAAYEPDLFDAVVANSPSDQINGAFGEGAASYASAWALNGRPLATGPIPVDRIRVPVLLTAGGSDNLWDSQDAAASVMRQLDARPGAPAHTYLFYPGVGHSAAGITPYAVLNPDILGGTAAANQHAAADAWPRILAFIAAAKAHPAP